MSDKKLQFLELEEIKYPLVNQFYKRVYKKGLARKNEAVFVLKNIRIVCSGKLKRLDQQRLLTGIACDPDYRGQGYASLLITKILQQQQQTIYCFSYAHLQAFYSRLGFVRTDPQTAPEIIRKTYSSYSKTRALLLMVYSSKSDNKD